MSRQAGRAGRTREQSGHSEGHSFVHQPPPPGKVDFSQVGEHKRGAQGRVGNYQPEGKLHEDLLLGGGAALLTTPNGDPLPAPFSERWGEEAGQKEPILDV